MKRIQKGPVKGISLRLQEEERERHMDFVPDVSAIDTQHIEVEMETIDMLQSLGMSDILGITQVDPVPVQQIPFGRPSAGFGGAQRRYRNQCLLC
ncbi:40S ribosomal protein S17-1-like [Arachis duranensis]|uniref:40S ribosomal protein S17-1-like n=1 Tax=Arachis duranensis TaxID=130453 RepID=A0A9C6WKS7_ARADU|nr:40S ribosomal protein S17-1-like [Arachis duranensis]